MKINSTIVVVTCRRYFRVESTPSIHVLLGKKPKGNKIRKPGAGKWVSGGGKRKRKEPLKACACRENLEEFGFRVSPRKLRRVGVLVGFASRKEQKPMWMVAVYHTHISHQTSISWKTKIWDDVGWFRYDKIPWKKMLGDDRKWLPGILTGRKKKPFRHVVYLS